MDKSGWDIVYQIRTRVSRIGPLAPCPPGGGRNKKAAAEAGDCGECRLTCWEEGGRSRGRDTGKCAGRKGERRPMERGLESKRGKKASNTEECSSEKHLPAERVGRWGVAPTILTGRQLPGPHLGPLYTLDLFVSWENILCQHHHGAKMPWYSTPSKERLCYFFCLSIPIPTPTHEFQLREFQGSSMCWTKTLSIYSSSFCGLDLCVPSPGQSPWAPRPRSGPGVAHSIVSWILPPLHCDNYSYLFV